MSKSDIGETLHLTDHPIEEGQAVTAAVDWDRRLDHMQQHTGELLSWLQRICKAQQFDKLGTGPNRSRRYVCLAHKRS